MTTHYDINWLKERFENSETLKYIFFWGHTKRHNEEIGKFCFSQWSESPFTVDNISYKTAEHWMMAHKAMLFSDKKIFEKIINCDKPGEAKELGRQVNGYNDLTWNKKKFDIVKLGNIHKFNQYPKFAEYLLKTENRILVEASPVDTIWGIGLSQDSSEIKNVHAWRGQNLLGFALMVARDFLNDFGHFSPLKNAIQTPWAKFPNVDGDGMFWRMGKVEDYLTEFSKYYQSLNDREKTIYKLTNPQPYGWNQFYDRAPDII
ncbi:NADAR family protein [Sphingobacterium alkalisoli]|uniref:NADAR family protein n=1 Tax=Sphingobacterium alkalisoli TaxID=1874115 RepID=A0A4U0GVJ4_9SPHI|nr:NADAR family protein [Sphingobacterium alkalisoli]TJY62594.1 NADAR family protein [Sphingobacterium alkalisoli]GGH27662.1 hypothetical protein GCM10011418_37740 [Sphingobacterium alkalisoli]